MSDSVLELIKNSSRPWKDFTMEFLGQTKKFYTRKLSLAEIDQLRSIYNKEFTKIRDSMDDDADIDVLRRNFSKQPVERIAKFIVDSDRLEYLAEASSVLDDLPYDDPKVKARADELAEEDKRLKEGAPKSELIDEAIERRAYVNATIRANEVQNQHLLLYAIYDENKQPLFPTIEDIQELDNFTINAFMDKAQKALGAATDSPLRPAEEKPPRKRTRSQKRSAEESTPS